MAKPKTIKHEGKIWYKLRANAIIKEGDMFDSDDDAANGDTSEWEEAEGVLGDCAGDHPSSSVWRLCDPQPEYKPKKSEDFPDDAKPEAPADTSKPKPAPLQHVPIDPELKRVLQELVTVTARMADELSEIKRRLSVLETQRPEVIVMPAGAQPTPQTPTVPDKYYVPHYTTPPGGPSWYSTSHSVPTKTPEPPDGTH